MRSEYEYLAYLRLEETPPSRPHQEEIQAGADLLAYPLFPFGLVSVLQQCLCTSAPFFLMSNMLM